MISDPIGQQQFETGPSILFVEGSVVYPHPIGPTRGGNGLLTGQDIGFP
jgi:hypothetical protein